MEYLRSKCATKPIWGLNIRLVDSGKRLLERKIRVLNGESTFVRRNRCTLSGALTVSTHISSSFSRPILQNPDLSSVHNSIVAAVRDRCESILIMVVGGYFKSSWPFSLLFYITNDILKKDVLRKCNNSRSSSITPHIGDFVIEFTVFFSNKCPLIKSRSILCTYNSSSTNN